MQSMKSSVFRGAFNVISALRKEFKGKGHKARYASRLRPLASLGDIELESRLVMTATVIGLNISGSINNNLAPPDTMGAIGPNHYVQFLNGAFNIYNRTTGVNLVSKTDYGFWQGVSGISYSDYAPGLSDPRIIYDSLSDRWFACQINVDFNGNRVLVARSNSNDPTAGWKGSSYLGSATGLADYPTLGVDSNGVYIGSNDFTPGFSSVTLTTIPKSDLLLNTPTLANRSTFLQTDYAMGFTLQGVTNFASMGSSANATILAVNGYSYSQLNMTGISGTSGANAVLGATTVIDTLPTSGPYDSRQPDGTRDIEGIDYRIGGMVYQVGDLIYSVHAISVNASGNAIGASASSTNAIRMTVLKASTKTVAAEATIFNPNFDYNFPSIAANASGDILIGFTRSSGVLGTGASNGNLGSYARYASINPNNPTSITLDASDIQLKAGNVSDYHLFGGPGERWGDYSATQVDPNNATSFWTTQEFAASSNQWGTQISQVYVPPRTTNITSSLANGTYTYGDLIPITIGFNDAVTVTGMPTLALNSGGTAVYASGSGTSALTFYYIAGVNDQSADLDYSSTTPIALSGGTIKDKTSGLDANLTLPAPGTVGSLGANKDIVIVKATVIGTTAVNNTTSSMPDYKYGVNSVIPIQLTFSGPVTVTGASILILNSGGIANYTSGSGSNKLIYTYTVGSGQNSPDLDYYSIASLGGTILDGSSNRINYALPAPRTAGSLGFNKNIIIDSSLVSATIVGNVYDVDTTQGIGQVRIYNDVNGNGKFDGTLVGKQSVTSTLRVVDMKTVTKALDISGVSLPIYGMTVTINLPHTHVGDLIVTLISPTNVRVKLISRQGGNGQNLKNAVFSDSADYQLPSGLSSYSGTYLPVESLSAFNGLSANGTWKMEVSDNAYGDVGSLTSFGLSITSTSEANVFTNSAGNYKFYNAAGGAWKLRADLSTNPTWSVANPAVGQINYVFPANSAVSGLNFGIKRSLAGLRAASNMGLKLGQSSTGSYITIPDQVVHHVATTKVKRTKQHA